MLLEGVGVDGTTSHARVGLDGSAQLEGFYSVPGIRRKAMCTGLFCDSFCRGNFTPDD